MPRGLDRLKRNTDLTMPESSSRSTSSGSDESTYSKSDKRGSNRSGKSGHNKSSFWGGGGGSSSSSSSKKKTDSAPQIPSRMVSPMPQPRTIGRKPRRRGSLGGTPSTSRRSKENTIAEEAMDSAQFRPTKRIVEDATAVVASSGPSPEEMDVYGYGYGAPDDAVPAPKLVVGSGRTPRRSSMKGGSNSKSSSVPSQSDMDKYGYGDAAPDEPAETTYDDLAPPSERRLVVGSGRAPRRSSLKCSKSDQGLSLYGQKQRRSSLGFSDDGSSDGGFDGGKKPSSKRRGSITFADYDAIQEVEPVKNLTSSHNDLWYKPEEIREINQHNRYMVDVAKSGEVKDRKLCIRGLESFLVPSRERKARQNKIWDLIMMIQDHQWENGVVDEEVMSRVLSQLSRDDTEMAATRAVQDATDTIKYLTKGSKKSSSSSSSSSSSRRDRPRRRQSLG
eukprot:CAMPEP_0113482252 /NCGR_PEP_ID=MMETSP0014_2-20120614/22823_1 /TAXON_ID=2857 /ORGANISM="Nitzschia sp." /LENGTH=446 /DNA_ID=CAMNT_0000375763 /DNA_START=380 /DNA_END=1720 /DNA_ORIENTATION=+ /assembly_acc=CAM_ASM_000159